MNHNHRNPEQPNGGRCNPIGHPFFIFPSFFLRQVSMAFCTGSTCEVQGAERRKISAARPAILFSQWKSHRIRRRSVRARFLQGDPYANMSAFCDRSVGTSMAAKPAKKKIMLVDDDPAVGSILLHLLTDEGYYAQTAASGVEALVVGAAMEFDLVVLDLNTPLKDGGETLEQLSSKNPLLPVILITARPNPFFPRLASGIGAFLEKPLDFVELFDTIRQLLEEPQELRLARIIGPAVP
jgi:CheY-like chemotaxis protein